MCNLCSHRLHTFPHLIFHWKKKIVDDAPRRKLFSDFIATAIMRFVQKLAIKILKIRMEQIICVWQSKLKQPLKNWLGLFKRFQLYILFIRRYTTKLLKILIFNSIFAPYFILFPFEYLVDNKEGIGFLKKFKFSVKIQIQKI